MGSIADGADRRNLWPVDEIPLVGFNLTVGITSKQCDNVKTTENTYVTIHFDAS